MAVLPVVTLWERVRSEGGRAFCAMKPGHCSKDYPEETKGEDDEPERCKSYRCTRCKSTIGWCKGADHGDNHPANAWCDDCFAETYGTEGSGYVDENE
jgi:hypothetical protein